MLQNKETGQNKKKKSIFTPPASMLINIPFIELCGNRQATIEGSKGILEYTEEVIRINTGNMVISFCGRNLNIKCLNASALVVEGYFTSIEFLS